MKMDAAAEIFTTKEKDKKQENKKLILSLLELILTKATFVFLELSMKYLDTLNNQLKKAVINKIST